MKRYFIRLAYDGSAYHGWQIQENAMTIQQVLNENLSILHQQKISVTGAGRTDTGVHALEMFAHFDLEIPFRSWSEWLHRINGLLPVDISILNLYETNPEAHARFDAVKRTYRYELSTVKDPFLVKRLYYFRKELDIKNMQDACQYFIKKQDFTSFSKLHTQTHTNICEVVEANWKKEANKYIFTVSADRFLRNMVRCMVGTMLEIGQSKMKPQEIKDILDAKDRSKAGYSVPACGLYLEKIEYGDKLEMNKLC